MLHRETIESNTLELLKSMMRIDVFAPLRLVGGTSLALQIGHRKSIDLDLFGDHTLNSVDITNSLPIELAIKSLHTTPSINIYLINGIKVDFVKYRYPWLEEVVESEGIRMAGKKDIAAMKLSAITGRGTKKDFIDLYFLLKEYRLAELIQFYLKKYRDGNEYLLLRSLAYFADADKGSVDMIDPISWEEVKDEIKLKYLSYMHSL